MHAHPEFEMRKQAMQLLAQKMESEKDEMGRKMRNPSNNRVRLVAYPRQHGFRGAACFFHTTVRSVRKGVRRHEVRGWKQTSANFSGSEGQEGSS